MSYITFLSTPSGWRATEGEERKSNGHTYFYPRPPDGGRSHFSPWKIGYECISIHALRVEGDPALFRLPISFPNFYPRPPGGGRRPRTRAAVYKDLFLSTPSGWRATRLRNSHITDRIYFYPRPPGGGRHARSQPGYCKGLISIHALRVEGDRRPAPAELHSPYFYPRPPGGGRRAYRKAAFRRYHFYPRPPGGGRPPTAG